MLEKNQKLELKIDGMNHEGQGVGRVDGFVVFVENALLGETVEAQIIKVTKSYAVGKLLNVIEPSANRVEPFCSANKRCGGCTLQHLSYEGQLEYKTQVVKDALIRIGGMQAEQVEAVVEPIIGMERPFEYRNKAPYPCAPAATGSNAETDKKALSIGFYAKRSHDIIEHDECQIQDARSTEIKDMVRDFCNTNGITSYNERTGKGILRHVITRIAFNTNKIMVIFVINGKAFPGIETLVSQMVARFPEVKSVYLNYNNKRNNVIMGAQSRVVFGDKTIRDSIGRLEFEISPQSFFQINPVQTVALYDKAKEFAGLTGTETVLDLYCGTGTIGLYLADKAKKIIGIEVVEPAVIDARKNARFNGVENAEFYVGEAEAVLPELVSNGLHADVVVIDPPRKGCDSRLINAVVDIKPDRVVYVSCNPSTLARDMIEFSKAGYEARKVQPVDMFPWTWHVECVVEMGKSG